MTALELLPDVPAGVTVTPTSITIEDPGLPFDTYSRLVAATGRTGDAFKWWLGDLLIFGESRYGEAYAQILDLARVTRRQAERYRYVAAQCQPDADPVRSRRRGNLSFSIHEEVAPLAPDDQLRLLAKAEAEDWTVEQTRDAVRGIRAMNGAPPRAARPQPLDGVSTVDAVRNLGTARDVLVSVGGGLEAGTAEAVGIPAAIKALDDAGATVRAAAALADRPALVDAARVVVAVAVRQSGLADPAYIVPREAFEELAARVAETDEGRTA